MAMTMPNNQTNHASRTLDFVNPATGERFGGVRMATAAEVADARRELGALAPEWAATPLKTRIKLLRQLQKELIDAQDEIAAVINRDNGKSKQDAQAEVIMTVAKLDLYTKKAPQWLARESRPRGIFFFRSYYTEPQPYGTVAVIGPWNYPFDLTLPVACSALLAGNTVLIKPSEVTGATGVMIETLINRVPELARYVKVLHGDGKVGAALVDSHPDLIFLTGSTRTGKLIGQKAAEMMIPFYSELGGKDPMIVLEDADIAAAAKWGAWASFYNAGQSCVSVERVYVVESVYERFVAEVMSQVQRISVGYSSAESNPHHYGPFTFKGQPAIVQDHLDDAVARGATVLTGGQIDGMFMQPTVLVDVDHSMKVMRDETFGPIMPIMKVKDETHAIQMANHSPMGLGASVWTGNLKRGERISRQLEVGTISINDALYHFPVPGLPFGGVKESGNARTHGREELLQFVQLRSVATGLTPLPFDLATIMRHPNHYRLGKLILNTSYGVTPRQRVEPLAELLSEHEVGRKVGKVAAATGVMAAISAVIVGLFRARR